MHGNRIIDWCGRSRSDQVTTAGMKNKIRATLQENNPDWDFQGSGGARLDFSELAENCDSYDLGEDTYINTAYFVKDSLFANCTNTAARACVSGGSRRYNCVAGTNTCHTRFARIYFKTVPFRETAPDPNWTLINHETAHILGFCDVGEDDPDCNSGSSDSVVHDDGRDWPSWPDHLSLTEIAERSGVPYLMFAHYGRMTLLSVTAAFIAGVATAGVLYWSGAISESDSTAEASVPAYLGQDTFSICVDNPSGRFDNVDARNAVLEAIEYGRKTPAWVGTYMEEAEIHVAQGCPLPPRPEDEPRFVSSPQSDFSVFIFVLDESEAALYGTNEKDYIPIWGIDSGPDRNGKGEDFVTYGIFVEPADLADTGELAGVIGAAYGRPSDVLSFEECETPNPGATDQSSGCDDKDFLDSDELNPDAPSR